MGGGEIESKEHEFQKEKGSGRTTARNRQTKKEKTNTHSLTKIDNSKVSTEIERIRICRYNVCVRVSVVERVCFFFSRGIK